MVNLIMQRFTLARTPFRGYVAKCVQSAKSSLRLMCPFIKTDVVDAILAKVPKQVNVSTLTRIEKIDFLRRSSDIKAADHLLKRGEVKRNPRIHAKIFIADDKLTLISSANLSWRALNYNFECGVLTDSSNLVNSAISFFDEVWNDSSTIRVTRGYLQSMQLAYDESRLIQRFEEFMVEANKRGLKDETVKKQFETYKKIVEEEEQEEIICKLVESWIEKDIQPAKIMKLLVSRKNIWISPKEVKSEYYEIKDPATVMYDLARRGSADYYVRRPRYYPSSLSVDPILEYDDLRGYRIKPAYLDAITYAVREALR